MLAFLNPLRLLPFRAAKARLWLARPAQALTVLDQMYAYYDRA